MSELEDRQQAGLRLDAFLPYRLSVLSNTISKQIANLYQAEFGLSIWQWRIMAVLGETSGLNATDIVTRTAMDKVAVSRAVSGLIDLGFVARAAAQDDGRRSILSLSAAGRKAYRRIVPFALGEEAAVTQALSDGEIKELNRLLGIVASAVSPDRALW